MKNTSILCLKYLITHVLFFFSLMWVCIFSAFAMDWDITDTGQPYHEATFTVTEASWMSVSVSPDGRTLLLDMLGDIYSLPAGGGKATLVHGGPAMEKMPTFSSDGSLIAYISDKGGSDNIWVSRTDGSEARQITAEATDILTSPAWSAGGEYILGSKLFAEFAKSRSSEIRMYHVDGGKGHLLVDIPPSREIVNEADASLDGQFVYYTEKLSPGTLYVDANHRNFAIKRLHLQSGLAETVVSGFGGAITPQISPDGKTLAFIRRVKDKTVLFSYNVETKEQTPVYADLDRDLQAEFIAQGTYYPKYDWFPDNKHVAIWGKGKLYRVNMETAKVAEIPFSITATHRYTNVPQIKHDLAPAKVDVKAIRQLQVSPDEKELLFSAVGSLWTADINGNNVRAFASNAEGNLSDAAYSPDGKYIVYVAWTDEGGSRLELAHRDGAYIRTLARSKSAIRQPSFSKDNRKIVYTIDGGDKCMGGFPGKSGVFWLDIKTGISHHVTGRGEVNFMTERGAQPYFSENNTRIYYSYVERDENIAHYGFEVRKTKLESIDLVGANVRQHAETVSTDVHDISISPDGKWIAFKEDQQYYIMPYRPLAGNFFVSKKAGVPVTRLTETGGFSLTWSPDSTKIYWLLGNNVFSASIKDFRGDHGIAPSKQVQIDLTLPLNKPTGIIAFVNGRIITMRENEVIENGVVVVRGNRILAVGTAENTFVPAEAKKIDISGKTLMPGFVNMHGHIEECYYDTTGLLPEKQPSHYASLAYGVTTNFDPYGSELLGFSQSEMQKTGVIVAPRLVSAGKAVYGRIGKVDASYVPINSLKDAQNLMRRKVALGGLMIKSYRQPMRSQRQMLVKAGNEAGIWVDGEGESHFYNNISMILDGHRNLEHNLPLATYYDDVLQFMAHGKTGNTPTLVVTFGEIAGENYIYQTTRAWEGRKAHTYLPKSVSSYSPVGAPGGAPLYTRTMTTLHAAEEIWDIGFRAVSRSTKKLHEAGVIINAGSHGQVQGLGMNWELWLLAEGGMPAYDVLKTATINGAKTLGVDHQVGTVSAGKLADLIILDKNPLENIRNTNSVHYTMINGRLYDSYSMDEIGNYNRPRSKFYWETHNTNDIEWNKAWGQ